MNLLPKLTNHTAKILQPTLPKEAVDPELTEAEIREMITDVLAEELTVDITDGDFTGQVGRPEIDRQRPGNDQPCSSR